MREDRLTRGVPRSGRCLAGGISVAERRELRATGTSKTRPTMTSILFTALASPSRGRRTPQSSVDGALAPARSNRSIRPIAPSGEDRFLVAAFRSSLAPPSCLQVRRQIQPMKENEGIVVLVAHERPCSEGLEHSATIASTAIVWECSDVVACVPTGCRPRVCLGGPVAHLRMLHETQFDPCFACRVKNAASHHSAAGVQPACGANPDHPARSWRFGPAPPDPQHLGPASGSAIG